MFAAVLLFARLISIHASLKKLSAHAHKLERTCLSSNAIRKTQLVPERFVVTPPSYFFTAIFIHRYGSLQIYVFPIQLFDYSVRLLHILRFHVTYCSEQTVSSHIIIRLYALRFLRDLTGSANVFYFPLLAASENLTHLDKIRYRKDSY